MYFQLACHHLIRLHIFDLMKALSNLMYSDGLMILSNCLCCLLLWHFSWGWNLCSFPPYRNRRCCGWVGRKPTKIGSGARKTWLKISFTQLFFLETRALSWTYVLQLWLPFHTNTLTEQSMHVSGCLHTIVPSLCSTVERLSPANEIMELPPKKEEKKVGFSF